MSQVEIRLNELKQLSFDQLTSLVLNLEEKLRKEKRLADGRKGSSIAQNQIINSQKQTIETLENQIKEFRQFLSKDIDKLEVARLKDNQRAANIERNNRLEENGLLSNKLKHLSNDLDKVRNKNKQLQEQLRVNGLERGKRIEEKMTLVAALKGKDEVINNILKEKDEIQQILKGVTQLTGQNPKSTNEHVKKLLNGAYVEKADLYAEVMEILDDKDLI